MARAIAHSLPAVGLILKQMGDVGGVVVEAGDEGQNAGVRFDLGGVEVQFQSPDEAGLLAQIDHLLEEALKDLDAQSLPDHSSLTRIRQRLGTA